MKIVLLLVKEDIETTPIGNNFQISTPIVDINLTLDAAKELLADLTELLKDK